MRCRYILPLVFVMVSPLALPDRARAESIPVLDNLLLLGGGTSLAVAEDGEGGVFLAGLVESGTGAGTQLRAVHMDAVGAFKWGQSGLADNNSYFDVDAADISAVPDGYGGLYVVVKSTDWQSIPNTLDRVVHFGGGGVTTLAEITQPQFGTLEAVSDGEGGIIVVNMPASQTSAASSYRVYTGTTGTPVITTWPMGNHNAFYYSIATAENGAVLLAYGDDNESRAQYLASDNTFPWGANGIAINAQTGQVIDRKAIYDASTGYYYVVWSEAGGTTYGQGLDDAGGEKWSQGGETLLTCAPYTTNSGVGLDVVPDRDGGFVVAQGQANICIQRFNEDGIPVWPAPAAETRPNFTTSPAPWVWQKVSVLKSHVVVSWIDQNTTNEWAKFTRYELNDGTMPVLSGDLFKYCFPSDPGFEQSRAIGIDIEGGNLWNYLFIARTGGSQLGAKVWVEDRYPTIGFIFPDAAPEGSLVSTEILAVGFFEDWEFSLERTGSPPIPLANASIVPDGTVQQLGSATGTFDLYGATVGDWDVVVRHPQTGEIVEVVENGYTVADPLFVEVESGDADDNGAGFGAAWVDFDGDSRPDLYLANQGPNKLVHYNGGTFNDVTTPPLTDASSTVSGVWADYDCDGDPDLYMSNYNQPNRLVRNDGGGNFTEVTNGPLVASGPTICATWVDYDNDGDPDLYVANHNQPNVLLRNDGTDVFTDVTPPELSDPGPTMAMSWSDYDLDGDADVYICRYTQANMMVRNDGAGVFVDVTDATIGNTGASMSCAWGDYDNDGWMDLYLVNRDSEDVLFRNARSGSERTLVDATSLPLGHSGRGSSPSWHDWDLDGDVDLLLTIDDGPAVTYRNDGVVGFSEVLLGYINRDPGRVAVWGGPFADEVYVASEVGPNQRFTTWTSAGNWIRFDDLPMIGVRVAVVVNGVTQTQEVRGGTGRGGQNSADLVFGLGTATQADEVRVYWPTGESFTYYALGEGGWLLPVPQPDILTEVTAGDLGASINGRGAGWADADDDGDLDLAVATVDDAVKLFRNDGGDVFVDVTPSLFEVTGQNYGVLWGDHDSDGDPDILILNHTLSSLRFLQNGGSYTFTDITSATLPALPSGSLQSMTWVDYDDDGLLDLYPGLNGFNRPYLAVGDGTFDDTAGLGAGVGSGTNDTWDVEWADFDDDGDLDVFLANENGANNLVRNDGNGTYTDVTSPQVAGTAETRSVCTGDYDNDGDLDLYLGNFDGGNVFLRNDGGMNFADVTSGPLGDTGATSHVSFIDVDNDRDLDLYIGNFGDDRLLRNDGGGVFVDASPAGVLPSGSTISAAWCDYDQDGDSDVLVSTVTGLHLLRNGSSHGAIAKSSNTNWVQLDLTDPIGPGPSMMIGARAFLTTGGTTQVRQVTASGSVSGQESMRIAWGLGGSPWIDELRIEWPNGTVTTETDVEGNRILLRQQPSLSAVNEGSNLPAATRLLPAYPNPANPMTVIRFELATRQSVELMIFDVAGRRVRTLLSGEVRPAGTHNLTWTGIDDRGTAVASGKYIVQMRTGSVQKTIPLSLIR